MAWYDSIVDFLGSSSVQNAVSTVGNIGSAGLDIYTGINSFNSAQSAFDAAQKAAASQAQFTQAQANQLRDLYYPIEQITSAREKQRLESTQGLYTQQLDYGVEQGTKDLDRLRAINDILDPAEVGLITKLSESGNSLRDRLQAQASQDVRGAFDSARSSEARRMSGLGLTPNSGAFQNYLNQSSYAKAQADAAARTQAARTAEDTALGRQAQAVQYRQGIAIPQQQYTPSTSASQVIGGLGNVASSSGQLGIAQGNLASDAFAGAQYSFSDLFNKEKK